MNGKGLLQICVHYIYAHIYVHIPHHMFCILLMRGKGKMTGNPYNILIREGRILEFKLRGGKGDRFSDDL